VGGSRGVRDKVSRDCIAALTFYETGGGKLARLGGDWERQASRKKAVGNSTLSAKPCPLGEHVFLFNRSNLYSGDAPRSARGMIKQ